MHILYPSGIHLSTQFNRWGDYKYPHSRLGKRCSLNAGVGVVQPIALLYSVRTTKLSRRDEERTTKLSRRDEENFQWAIYRLAASTSWYCFPLSEVMFQFLAYGKITVCAWFSNRA